MNKGLAFYTYAIVRIVRYVLDAIIHVPAYMTCRLLLSDIEPYSFFGPWVD